MRSLDEVAALEGVGADDLRRALDRVDGRLMIVRTDDGRDWERVPADRMPALIPGEVPGQSAHLRQPRRQPVERAT
mgnify:CR=1 FL=1